MTTPGPRNSVTDIAGLAVGNAHDAKARSGVTVLLPDRPVLTAVDVRGVTPIGIRMLYISGLSIGPARSS